MKLAAVTGYIVAGTCVFCGVLLTTGVVLQQGSPPQMRIVLGVVLVLMGIHRFAVTRMKTIQRSRDND